MDTSSLVFNRGLTVIVVVFFVFGLARFAMMPHYGEGDGYRYANHLLSR